MSITVTLSTVNDVKDFVNAASKMPVEIDAIEGAGTHKIDAKSIMGMFSLNLSEPVRIEYNSEDTRLNEKTEKTFLDAVNRFRK